MRLIPATVNGKTGLRILCEKCDLPTWLSDYCSFCNEKFPKEMIRKREFVNGMAEIW